MDVAESIVQTADGGFVIAGGASSSNGQITLSHGGSECWIVKTDGSGTIQWEKSYGGSDYDQANKIRLLGNGDLLHLRHFCFQ